MELRLTCKSASSFAIALLVLGTAAPVLAATDSSDADTKLISALTITNVTGLNFGTLVVESTLAAPVTVTIDPNLDSAGTIASSNSTDVFPLSGHTESVFTVTGDGAELVQVTAPATITLEKGGGGSAATEMTISALDITVYDDTTPTELYGGGQFTMPADGDATLEVGGVLTVNDDDEMGDFTGTFDIQVEYV